MKFTGEQLIPGVSKKRLEDEHFERYNFVLSFVKNKKVLDMACGTGYGSKMMSDVAKNVIGVDISSDAIGFARENCSNNKTEFILSSATKDLFNEGTFDVICSFETIEHLNKEARKKYLKNLNKYLKPGGILFLSTPNNKITSPFSKKPINEFHILEFCRKQLSFEIEKYFKIEKIYGQRLVKRIYTYYFIRKFIHLIQKISKKDLGLYSLANGPMILEYNKFVYEPRIFFVIAKK